MKKLLKQLGYLRKEKLLNSYFDKDTEAALIKFQSTNKDLDGNQLKIDGLLGQKSWGSIVKASKVEVPAPVIKIEYTRLLKLNVSGEDVLFARKRLVELNYLKQVNNIFDSDMLVAVKEFQKRNLDKNGKALAVDGLLGPLSWYSLFKDTAIAYKEFPSTPTSEGILNTFTHILPVKRAKIEKELVGLSDLRIQIVLEALNWAFDADAGGEVRALYVYNTNLYNPDKTLLVATENLINQKARENPIYFNGNRKEWMIQQMKKNPNLPCADCSGFIVGLLRKHGLVPGSWDVVADTLFGSSSCSTRINKADLRPGDYVGRTGHIGIYVGGGFVVEFYGGAYGCQLTELDNRKGYDFLRKYKTNGTAWAVFSRPIHY
jgi:hypothetical protein